MDDPDQPMEPSRRCADHTAGPATGHAASHTAGHVPPGRRARDAPGDRTDHDWTGVAQQLLDGMDGQHSLVTPVRGRDGLIEDYLFVAASAAVVDLSGRTGREIVGSRVSEIYPSIVDGPLWDAWRQTLADGQPRHVGPFPYQSAAERAPAGVLLGVRVRAVGPGLLNSWVRLDEETRLEERVAQTERLGNLGWGEWDLITGDVSWSPGLYRIYERDPAEEPLSRARIEELTLPEDLPLRRRADEAFARGETADMIHRVRVGGRTKHLRSIIDAVRDATGRPVRLYGIVQDVTAQETNRARLAQVEQQLHEHRRSLAAEHRLAAELQQIILPIPAEPIDLPRLRVALRYLPAVQAERVGGDWYHAAVAGDGSVILAVGDVAGHGVRAAARMAQLRHALAALAVTTTSEPAELLTHLNRLLFATGQIGDEPAGLTATTATAVVARYDPATGDLVWAQAGHPPPLHTRAGRTTELDRPPGPVLGALPEPSFGTARTRIELGDILLFYTDGLVEQRERSLREGLAPVIATLDHTSAQRRPQPLAEIIGQLRYANPRDDTCVLAARRLPAPEGGGDHG